MVDDDELKRWFCESVLPLEAELTSYIRQNWRATDEVADIRQEIYENVLSADHTELPMHARPYLIAIARNLIINKVKRARVVCFEQVAELGLLDDHADLLSTERHLDARDALRRAQAGLNALPPRCREVVYLRKVEGLTTAETADRLGVGIHTVERQLVLGIRAMADFLLGGTGRIRRTPAGSLRRARR